MRVEDLRTERSDGIIRFAATVRWDDRSREPCDVYYAIRDSDDERASLNPDSFRIPASIVALHDGERNLSGAEPLCPVLHDGLQNAFAWLSRWSGSTTVAPVLDFPIGCSHPRPGPSPESAAFLSGGVDSLALIVNNQGGDPPVRERRFSMALAVAGIQKNRWNCLDDVAQELEHVSMEMGPIGDAANLDIVPVATNIRSLHPETKLWKYEFQGAALAGVAHLFAKSLGDVSIASTWKISHLGMWGSHPLLDPNFGTDTLRIWHELAHLSRLGKLRIISRVPEFLNSLNVCNSVVTDGINCGRCEKCLRTMLELAALGLLEESGAFEGASLEPDDLRVIHIDERGLEAEYLELVGPLRAVGRGDLADAIARQIRLGHASKARRLLGGLAGHWRSRASRVAAP
jgi:hypothetical protein